MRKIYPKILQYTSIPLFVLLYISYLSGYGITRAEIVETLTFGLLDYGVCVKLHTSLLNYFTSILAFLHGASGLIIMITRSRRIRRKRAIEGVILIILALMLIQLSLLEFGWVLSSF